MPVLDDSIYVAHRVLTRVEVYVARIAGPIPVRVPVRDEFLSTVLTGELIGLKEQEERDYARVP